jgi:hypothetical protein
LGVPADTEGDRRGWSDEACELIKARVVVGVGIDEALDNELGVCGDKGGLFIEIDGEEHDW